MAGYINCTSQCTNAMCIFCDSCIFSSKFTYTALGFLGRTKNAWTCQSYKRIYLPTLAGISAGGAVWRIYPQIYAEADNPPGGWWIWGRSASVLSMASRSVTVLRTICVFLNSRKPFVGVISYPVSRHDQYHPHLAQTKTIFNVVGELVYKTTYSAFVKKYQAISLYYVYLFTNSQQPTHVR